MIKVPPDLEDPASGIPVNLLLQGKILSDRPPRPKPAPDEVNVGVTIEPHWPGKQTKSCLVARSDFNMLQRLDPKTLEPLEAFTWAKYDNALVGQSAASHSEIDPETQEEFNFNLTLGPSPTYKVFKIKNGASPKVTILAEIKDAPPCYLHSLFTTKRYVVLGIWQAIYKYKGLLTGLSGNLADGIEKSWNPNLPVSFYVIDREGCKGVVKVFTAPAHYSFHTINAYDDQDDIILTYCKLDNNSPIWRFQLKYLRSLPRSFTETGAYFAKVRLPNVTSGEPRGQAVDVLIGTPKNNVELPQINPAHTYAPFRYLYGIHSTDLESLPFHGLIRYDCHEGTPEHDRALVWAPDNLVAGEPLFVRDPSLPATATADTELGGVLLSMIFDATVHASGLVAIDPATMTEIGRAMMPRGTIAALGFHGTFTQDEFAWANKA